MAHCATGGAKVPMKHSVDDRGPGPSQASSAVNSLGFLLSDLVMTGNDRTNDTITAALIVIGEEILSGRTRDENISHIARYLNDIGIALQEVRVVRDIEAEIVAAVNELRARYSYVFTTGGIGPTHDDVTTDAIAKAFGVEVAIDPAPSRPCARAIARSS